MVKAVSTDTFEQRIQQHQIVGRISLWFGINAIVVSNKLVVCKHDSQ
jgi:hypothetical protein